MSIFPRCCAASLCRVDVIFKRKRLGFRILARLGQLDVVISFVLGVVS